MNYKLSEELVSNKNRIVVDLKGHFLTVSNGTDNIQMIDNARVVIELLNTPELERYFNLKASTQSVATQVDEVIVRDKVVEILDYPGWYIDLDLSPAGTIKWLADAIYHRSYSYFANAEEEYGIALKQVIFTEQMAAIISKIMHIPYTEVIQMPVSQIFKLHSICHMAFPTEVFDIRKDKNELKE